MAGFDHVLVMEQEKDCCSTLRANKRLGVRHVRDWVIEEQDIRKTDFTSIEGPIDFVGAGVPCQPFSRGGKKRGHQDERDMFPEFIRAVAWLQPKAFLIENVSGLLRQSFAEYFRYIILRLSHPMIRPGRGRAWQQHLAKLERIHGASRSVGPEYDVAFRLMNAADYGVPQKRERVFIVGFRKDLDVDWSFPTPTHSYKALVRDKWITGEYWERHELPGRRRPNTDAHLKNLIEQLKGCAPLTRAWRTVRDAICDLPRLRVGQTDGNDDSHFLNPGARTYHGHTGSRMDDPAKTLKAGSHGVPGGENTIVRDGSQGPRYFSVRECARLQTFPDEYIFVGAWISRMRQLGNAVPIELARIVSSEILAKLRTQPACVGSTTNKKGGEPLRLPATG